MFRVNVVRIVNRTSLLKSRMFSADTESTIGSCTREIEARFREANLPEAICDIQFIIAHAIGLKTVSM